MRMSVADLQAALPSILEGILLWAEDSKNKFRLKVRVILERLARRCGFEALDAAMPDAHRALLTHIRKQHNRRERKRGEDRSEMDWEADGGEDNADARSKKSKARTAARSAWASDVFSDEDGEDAATQTARTARTAQTAARRGGSAAARSVRSAPGERASRRLPSGGDPLNLLDASASRKIVRAQAGGPKGAKEEYQDDFQRGEGGKMVIRDEEAELAGKRKRGRGDTAGFDSDDSDFEDLKGFSGISLALKGAKSVAQAPSIAASLAGRSIGGRSVRSSKSAAPRGAQHTGDRFKSKKKGTGGDVKGNSKVEPYAYWPLDRRLMNRRVQKTRSAKAGLDSVVSAAKEGAAKGRKAKRMRR